MFFRELSVYLEKLEKTASRLEITSILTDLFKKSDKNEIDKVVYLSLGVLAPNYEGVLLNSRKNDVENNCDCLWKRSRSSHEVI
jgi:hypothetical protein